MALRPMDRVGPDGPDHRVRNPRCPVPAPMTYPHRPHVPDRTMSGARTARWASSERTTRAAQPSESVARRSAAYIALARLPFTHLCGVVVAEAGLIKVSGPLRDPGPVSGDSARYDARHARRARYSQLH